MNLTISGHHLEITPALRNYVTGKLDRITRHFDQVVDVKVLLSIENQKEKEGRQKPNAIFTSKAATCLQKALTKICTQPWTNWLINWTAKWFATKIACRVIIMKALSESCDIFESKRTQTVSQKLAVFFFSQGFHQVHNLPLNHEPTCDHLASCTSACAHGGHQ